MGKLIGQLFKEDIKSTILWFILPPIGVISFLTMLIQFGENPIIQILSGISMMLVFMAPFIALIQIAVNDWSRFYGKNSAFYSAIPLCAGRTTLARLINYILMGIIATIVAIINFSILAFMTAEEGTSINDIGEVFSYIINYFGAKLSFVIFLYVLFLGVMVVSQILFANTLGSSKGMKKLGNLAPVLMFIIINFLTSFIFGRVQILAAGEYIAANVAGTNIDINIATNPPFKVLIIPIIISIILSALMAGASYYIHDKKLSVA